MAEELETTEPVTTVTTETPTIPSTATTEPGTVYHYDYEADTAAPVVQGKKVIPKNDFDPSTPHGDYNAQTNTINATPRAGKRNDVTYSVQVPNQLAEPVSYDPSNTTTTVNGSNGQAYNGEVTYTDAAGVEHTGYLHTEGGTTTLYETAAHDTPVTTEVKITKLNDDRVTENRQGSITYTDNEGNYVLRDDQGIPVDEGTVVSITEQNAYTSKADNYNSVSNHNPNVQLGVKRADNKTYFTDRAEFEKYVHEYYPDQDVDALLATGDYAFDETIPRPTGESSTPGEAKVNSTVNGIGSYDREDVHDEWMHETHVTQTTGSDNDGWNAYGNMGEDGKAIEGKRDSLEGANHDRARLNNNVKLAEIVNTPLSRREQSNYAVKNDTGNPLRNKDIPSFSKLDYIATYAATGQYHAEDLKLMVNALAENGVQFSGHPARYFKGTDYEQKLNSLGDQNYTFTANDLRSEIEAVKTKFQAAHDQFISWEGQASKKEKEAIETILGKFETTMGNLEQALEPACEAIDKLKGKLEELKKGEEELFKLMGEDPDGGVYETGSSLKELNKKLEEANRVLLAAKNRYSEICRFPVYKKRQEENGTNPDGTTAYKWVTTDEWTDEYAANRAAAEADMNEKQTVVDNLNADITAKKAEIEEKQTALDELLFEVITLCTEIENYEQTLDTFGSFFFGSGERVGNSNRQRNPDMDRRDWIASKEAITSTYHDSIIRDFSDYSLMPVITPISGHYEMQDGHAVVVPYKVGDVLIHDDAHGYYYAVTGEFDPLTGTIRIARFDKDGKKIGSDVTIWDQREIVPIKYVRDYHPEWSSIPDNFSEPTTTEKTTEKETEKRTEKSTEKTTERTTEKHTEKTTEKNAVLRCTS